MNTDGQGSGPEQVGDIDLAELTPSLGELVGVDPEMADRKEFLTFLTLSVLFTAGLIAGMGYVYLKPVLDEFYPLVGSNERICALLQATCSWGPIVYILLTALEVVTIFWPFPTEMAGGFLFGLPLGIIYSTIGLTLGSLLAFLLGRLLEDRITRLLGQERVGKFLLYMQRQGTLAAFFILMAPAIPKDWICYLLGLTRMPLGFYLVAVTLVRLPETVILTLQGIEAFHGNVAGYIGLTTANLAVAGLAYRYRHYLYKWLKQ
jgi:uncharacterized membrane protein YdjX (TVP38/TMEM64 family)